MRLVRPNHLTGKKVKTLITEGNFDEVGTVSEVDGMLRTSQYLKRSSTSPLTYQCGARSVRDFTGVTTCYIPTHSYVS